MTNVTEVDNHFMGDFLRLSEQASSDVESGYSKYSRGSFAQNMEMYTIDNNGRYLKQSPRRASFQFR